MTDARQFRDSSARNRVPILDALQPRLGERGVALEVACGSGQHAAHFAAALPGWTWWPSDPDAAARASTAAWCEGLANVRPPLAIDVAADAPWPGAPRGVDLLYACNLLHISPWAATAGLMRGAAAHLAPGGRLVIYGAVIVPGEPTAPSNLAFDADLRSRDPRWGLRSLADIEQAARREAALSLRERLPMPMNNQLLIFAA